ncbi:AAA+ ATPase [Columbia Basin potato purple top phytoplasma]|uniref:AAA+ ATPase n=1 Tax=Columbia Basin potato purple top phytoplasma TaxID=307134 RepID=A0ABT5LB31_9MOLU|nr:AAA+ ATPase [Columbia Basin potato purple top phytoplasma]
MIMKKYSILNPNYKQNFLKGDFKHLNQYLNQNFRCFGYLYNSSELLLKITDKPKINTYVFLEYLEKKYLK